MTDTPGHPPALRVTNLSKAFEGKTVLDQISFSLRSGERVTVVGASGTGKSVLLKCLVRLMEPDEGKIEIGGTDIATLDPLEVRRRACLVVQVPVMFEGTVRENLAYPFLFRSNSDLPRPDYVSLLETVGLSPALIDSQASTLSVGQQQRVAIARAIGLDPEILLLDEPSAALDPESTRVLERSICRLNEHRQRTVLIVTHDMAQATRLGERTLNLAGGRIRPLSPRDWGEAEEGGGDE